MTKFISVSEAVELIPDGATIMCGGFMGCGNAHRIIDALSKSGKGGFTLISNDGSMLTGPQGEEVYGVAKLIRNGQVSRLIASHVGLNPEVAARMNDGSMQVDLIPQGSLAEMIRAGGAGLGGVLTPTGVGTMVEDNHDFTLGKVTVDGRDYLHMRPLRADVALISGHRVDKSGNIWYKGTTRNFNLPMATAADLVIAEAEQVVEVGKIEPENVHTYGVLVDYVVEGGRRLMEHVKEFIAARVARELKDGDVVNLGIGLPTLVPNYLPADVHVTLQSENGIVGLGSLNDDNRAPSHVTDAGGQPSAIASGGAFIDSCSSFGLIRGGHVDATILGGLEVDEEGSLSNWIIPGKKVPGMGGAMDLLVGARNVIVAMEHTAKGKPKILKKCRLPYTAVKCVDKIITEMGVIEVTGEGLELVEYNPEFTVEQIRAATEASLIISPKLIPMV